MASLSTTFHVLWRCLFVLAVFFVCLPHSSDGDAELEKTLRCSLLGKFDKKCPLDGPKLNQHMVELLKRSPAAFRDILRGGFGNLKPSLVGKIPLALVFLLPPEIWSRVEPKVASDLIKTHRRDEAVAVSVTRGISGTSLSDRKDFLAMTDFNSLDPAVVSVMASEISSNWTLDKDSLIYLKSPTFFVALPEAHILEMDRSQQVDMLNEIVGWDRHGLNTEKWSNLPVITKRVWAIVGRNYTWEGTEKRMTTPLLSGATPTELQQEGILFSEYELLQLPLKNRLQIRALFPIVRTEDRLGVIDLSLLKNWFLLLSPDQIHRFRDDLEFMHVVKEKQYEYWAYPSRRRRFAFPSVPTLRQVIEITTMVNNERQILPLDPTEWRDEIMVFGPLTFLIGARRLGRLDPELKPLQLHTLKHIDSYHYSKRMARHLMFNSNAELKVRGLLRGVPTGRLRSLGGSDVGGMDQVREVVQNMPADGPARTALVFRKLRENLGVFINLEAILRNPLPDQFMSLLTFEETTTLYKALAQHWARFTSDNLIDKIHCLPDSVLANLLSSPKKPDIDAILIAHVETKALAGLTCDFLLTVDTTVVPEMIAAMRHARKRAGKTDMSKKLQRCARIALDKYLIERASATHASRKFAMASTVSAINPVDIENFGGFLLSTFPLNEIESSPYAKLIMKKIGELSVYELISANPCYKCLREMAGTAVRINNAQQNITFMHLMDLGSLVGFLPLSLISSVYPADWRIKVEAMALDGSSPPICADEASRASWERIIRSAFGPPEQWKADTLAALGAYMPVLLENTLRSVSLEERASAGDTLGFGGASYLEGVETVGYDHPRPFWKVCRDLLERSERKDYESSLRTAARFQLNSAQLFAGKVESADTLKQLKTQYRLASVVVATTTETPRDLKMQVDVPTVTTTASSSSNPWLWSWNRRSTAEMDLYKETVQQPVTSNMDLYKETVQQPVTSNMDLYKETVQQPVTSNMDLYKETVQQPVTSNPAKTDKMEMSLDLEDFIKSTFEGQDSTTFGPVTLSTRRPRGESTDSVVTEAVLFAGGDESVALPSEGVVDASIEFIRKDQENMNKVAVSNNSPNQVYVDEENDSADKTDGTSSHPSDQLNMQIDDIQNVPVVEPIAPPPPETNGTVYDLSNIQRNLKSSEEETGSETSATEAVITETDDAVIAVTPDPVIMSKAMSTVVPGNETSSFTPSSAELSKSVEFQKESLPTATPILGSDASSSRDAPVPYPGSARRRRDVDVEAFQTELTCDGLLTMGPASALALSTSDVNMPYEELEDCVEFIGNLELSKEVARAFWKRLKKATYWNTIGDVGCLAAGMTSQDVDNLDLDLNSEHFLDTISAVSLYADKDVVKVMLSKLKTHLDEEVAQAGKVSLAEEIVLALGQDICYLSEDSRSHLVNTPNVLIRSLSGMNRDGFFERTPCQPECLQGLLKALLNQDKTREWTRDDSRNAGVLVAGFSEEELKKMSNTKTSKPLGEISASAVRCLSESQLKAMDAHSLTWWSPLAAGALTEDQTRVLTDDQKTALEKAIHGRPGISPSEETGVASCSAKFTISFVFPTLLVPLILKCLIA